jgi:hypothetical protein
MIVAGLQQVALDALAEMDLVAAGAMMMRQFHQREVRQLAVDLRKSNA